MTGLRRWNVLLAVAHAAQGVAILVLANEATIPITWSYIDGPPASGSQTTDVLYDLPFGPAVAAFLFLAALDRGLMAAPRVVGWYERNLAAEMNQARWWEYSVSASLVVLIAMLTGIRDVTALIALFSANAAMILFGLLMERVNRPRHRPLLQLRNQMVLQYRRVGPWRDYVFGERVYLALSLVAKSALAWQVFAGALAG